jgi:hypothetical protein
MTVELIVELITSVGFPIALCIAMGYFIWTIYKRSEVREDKLRQTLAEAQANTQLALETLHSFSPRLDQIEEDIKDIKGHLE